MKEQLLNKNENIVMKGNIANNKIPYQENGIVTGLMTWVSHLNS